MKKLYLLAIVLFACIVGTVAQTPKIEKSMPFEDDPGDGWKKVLQLKNGNTFFFHFQNKEGIELTIYDKSRKKTVSKTVTSQLWDERKMKSTEIKGLYEINGQPVLFLMQSEGREPTLYRVCFDGTNGHIVKETELGSLPKTSIFAHRSALTAELSQGNISDVYVEKDPESDCYAVIFFNGYHSDAEDRIKIIHFDGDHKPINAAFFEPTNEDFKVVNFIGAVVDGNKRVYLATYGAESRRGKNANVFISRLNVGDSVFVTKPLDFTEDFRDTRSMMYYNHASNTIDLLSLSYERRKASILGGAAKSEYAAFISFIDPETQTLKGVKPIMDQKINEYEHSALNSDDDYTGIPQQMLVNKDNSITVLSEDLTREIIRDSKGNIVAIRSYLGPTGVTELNEDGTEKSGYMFKKRQMVGGFYNALYVSDRGKGRWAYQRGGYAETNGYMSFDYVNTEKSRYIIFNDYPKNFDREENSRKKLVDRDLNLNDLNTICYTYDNGQVKKFYLFGEPQSKHQANVCMLETSHFLPATNTYAALLTEIGGGNDKTRIVWVTFE
jgi:hypothetical protein